MGWAMHRAVKNLFMHRPSSKSLALRESSSPGTAGPSALALRSPAVDPPPWAPPGALLRSPRWAVHGARTKSAPGAGESELSKVNEI